MKINRFLQVVSVTGAMTLGSAALASSMPAPSAPSTLCDGDSDDDDDDTQGETLCGGDSDDDDKDDTQGETLCGGDSDDDDDGEETTTF